MAPEVGSGDSGRRPSLRSVALVLGPLLGLLVLLAPTGLDPAAQRLAAVFALVIVYWVTEAIPLAATALLGPTLALLLGVASPRDTYASFGHPIIFVFLGSFLIARAMSIHGLDRRIALFVLSRRWVGERPERILLAFGATGFLLSMWVSNTATTAMMLPIATGVLATLGRAPSDGPAAGADGGSGTGDRGLATGLMLMVAYACNVGGIATPVGTPPNLIAIGIIEKATGRSISFFRWMLVGVPIAVAGFAIIYVVIRWLFPFARTRLEGARERILAERRKLGAWKPAEKVACGAFGLAVLLWILPGLATALLGPASPAAAAVNDRLPESAVALVAASVLFLIPARRPGGGAALTWKEASGIDWGTILLFGGGLSLGSLAFQTGLARALGEGLLRSSGTLPVAAVLLIAILMADLLTEFMSNTATANLLVPLFLSLGLEEGGRGALTAVGVAIGCSLAFCLPVATPPNAIVYASGRVPLGRMIRTGILVDVLCIAAAWCVLILWGSNLPAP